MEYKVVTTTPFQKEIAAPRSKSYASRLLILAALEQGETIVAKVPSSSDVAHLIACLERIGLSIKRRGGEIKIHNSFPDCESRGGTVFLETGDGGTTNRFIAALVALGSRKYVLKPTGRMATRPMDELLQILAKLGAEVERTDEGISIRGPIHRLPRALRVDCRRSSQFASALLLALSKTDIQIKAENLGASRPYWELSGHLLQQRGRNFFVIPPDFSGMAFPLALAATNGEVSITNYAGRDPFQGDSTIVDILDNMGAAVDESQQNLRVGRRRLKSIEYDCADCLDIVPIVSYLCSYAEGVSRLGNIATLRYKESDRIAETLKLLRLFGVDHRFDGEYLYIKGAAKTIDEAIDVHPPDDHRMIMTAYLFLRKNGGGRLYNYQGIEKSFPHFFEAMS